MCGGRDAQCGAGDLVCQERGGHRMVARDEAVGRLADAGQGAVEVGGEGRLERVVGDLRPVRVERVERRAGALAHPARRLRAQHLLRSAQILHEARNPAAAVVSPGEVAAQHESAAEAVQDEPVQTRDPLEQGDQPHVVGGLVVHRLDEGADVVLEAVDAGDDDLMLDAQTVRHLRGDQLLQDDAGVRRGRERAGRRGGSGRLARIGGEDPGVPAAAEGGDEPVVVGQGAHLVAEGVCDVLDAGRGIGLDVQPRPALPLEAHSAVLDGDGLPRPQATDPPDGGPPAQRRAHSQHVRPRVPVRLDRALGGQRAQVRGEPGGRGVVCDVDGHSAGDAAQQLVSALRVPQDEGIRGARGRRVRQV